MKFFGLALALAGAVLSACTRPNPRSCKDGSCTDPAFPYCDADGSLGGEEKTCIAVACTPGALIACRGNNALTCNAAGGDYDLVQCGLGCKEAAGGCQLCRANETACTNGKVATCDASGKIVSAETCALGCFEDQPRCREIVPSNNLRTYLDMVASPPTLELSNATFNVQDGSVTAGGLSINIPSFLAPGAGNGVQIRVFVVDSLKLNSGAIRMAGDGRAAPGPAVAIVARGDLILRGEILVEPRVGSALAGCARSPGTLRYPSANQAISTGGGGGGNATVGAPGGYVAGNSPGGGDPMSGTSILVPLRGGCSGGIAVDQSGGAFPSGGGAMQLSSRTRIDIDATVNLDGDYGIAEYDGMSAFSIGGGGGGGSFLIEAPSVALGTSAQLLLRGGHGARGCTTPGPDCGDGGNGATGTTPAQVGTTIATVSNAMSVQAGGGGGGLGRLRVNTADGHYTKASSAVEEAAVTSGTVQTR